MDEDLIALRRRVTAVEDRLNRIERAAYICAGVLAIGCLLVGLFVPFIQASKPSDDPGEDKIALLPTISALAEAGDGPFDDEAIFASVLVGVFAIAVVTTAAAIVWMLAEPTPRRIAFLTVCGWILLAGCVGAWLLVVMLAARSEGRSSAFSPAMLLMTIGAGIALVTARLARERL